MVWPFKLSSGSGESKQMTLSRVLLFTVYQQNDEPSSNGVHVTPLFDVPGTATSRESSLSRYGINGIE